MRFFFVTVTAILTSFLASCQTPQNAQDGEQVMIKLSGLYNDGDYHALYGMLSPDFKAQAPEKTITEFYATNMKPLGKLQSWKPDNTRNGALNYIVQFEHGTLDLALYLNGRKEIAGMLWKPSAGHAQAKRDMAHVRSNNPKETRMQLLADSVALAHMQDAANCGLAIGITYNGKTELFFYGSGRKESNDLPDARTLYEIGSLTKTFTGIVLAHAVHEGKLSLADDIRKYLPGKYPGMQYDGRPITILNLANHTSGLPRVPGDLDKQPGYDPENPYKHYSRQMVYDYLATVQLNTQPGSKSEYSNLGVGVLGIILENIYKQSLDELVKKYVTAPAGMSSTLFHVPDTAAARMAIGYKAQTGATASYWDLNALSAAGGLKSDLEDMMRYLAANMQEINADFRLAHEPTFKNDQMATGLAWMIRRTKDNDTLIWHNGGTFGFTSFCGYLKEQNAGVVVLNNSGNSVDGIAIDLLRAMKSTK